MLGELRRQGAERSFTADRAAGTFLLDLYGAAGVPASIGAYAQVVLEHSYRRQLVAAGERLMQHAGTLALDELRELFEEQTEAVRAAAARLLAVIA